MFDGCPAYNVEQPLPPTMSPSSSWLHTPPSQMPWGVPISEQPTVMRFTGGLPSSSDAKIQTLPKCHTKRKSWDCEIEYPVPLKQLITEEKMAENLNCMHISNSYVSHQIGSNQPMSISLPGSSQSPQTSEVVPDSSLSYHTVSLCEQLRKLISEASVITAPIINKVERPSNALVLWQPPGGSILKQVVKSLSEEEEKKKHPTANTSPSTSTLTVPLRSSSQSRWDDWMDNNNSSNAMDLNRYTPTSLSSSQVLPSDVPLPDDDFMDLPEESMMDY